MELLHGLPAGVLVALGVLGAIQLSLQVFGLVDLSRREAVPGGRKWVWAVVIVLGTLVGALAYLVLGRRAPGAPEPAAPSPGTADAARSRTIDRLYGGHDG